MIYLSSFLGIACSALMAVVLNKMPAKCFCDYDETPDQRHKAPRAGKWALTISAFVLASVFPVLFSRFGLSVKTAGFCMFSVILMMITLSDIRYCIIPDELIIAGCILATAAVFPDILSGEDWRVRLAPVFGAAVGAGIIFGINALGRLLYKKDALGMGDLKLMIICGIACGPSGTALAMLSGILAAGIWFAVGIAVKRVRSESYMPLGPFLVLGTLFILCFRPMVDAFLAWYISLI